MDAKIVCENLLSAIRSSGLNFVLSETPFSVNIVIKKTFISSRNDSKLQTSKVPAKHLAFDQHKKDRSVINKQVMGTNFNQKTGNCDPIRPNAKHSTWKTFHKLINTKNNNSLSATTKSSMKDRSTLSTWHHATIPAIETTTSTMTQKMNISSSNSAAYFPNLLNLSQKKASVPGSFEVCRSANGNDEEQDESNNLSEPNIPTFNKFQVLDKLTKEPSCKAVENDVHANLSLVLDSEDILDEADLEKKPEKMKIIDELNEEQLRTYFADFLKPVQL